MGATMAASSAAQEVIMRLQVQIAEVQQKILDINELVTYKTGNQLEDTLGAVSADGMREYWEIRLGELTELLDEYQSMPQGDEVVDGRLVTLEREQDQTVSVLRIASRVDLYPGEKVISASSPLGVALMGKEVGATIQVNTPAGTRTYKLLAWQ